MARGDEPLRRRQARPPLRHGARRAHRRVRRHRVQGVRIGCCDQGHQRVRQGGGVRAQPARQAHRQGEEPRGQRPRVVEGHRRRWVRVTGREVPVRRRGEDHQRAARGERGRPRARCRRRVGRHVRGARTAAQRSRSPAGVRGTVPLRVDRRLPDVRRGSTPSPDTRSRPTTPSPSRTPTTSTCSRAIR